MLAALMLDTLPDDGVASGCPPWVRSSSLQPRPGDSPGSTGAGRGPQAAAHQLAAGGQDLGNLRAPSVSQTATGGTGRRQLRRPRRQRLGLRSSRHRENTRPVRLGPPAGGFGQVGAFAPAYRLVQDLLAASGTWPCRDNYGSSTLRLPAVDDLGYLPQGIGAALHPHRRRAPVPGHHLQPGLLPWE